MAKKDPPWSDQIAARGGMTGKGKVLNRFGIRSEVYGDRIPSQMQGEGEKSIFELTTNR